MSIAHIEDIKDNYHGTIVADPYRWLENPDAPATLEWVDEQNELTEAFLQQAPARPWLKERLTALWNYPKYSAPHREGSDYFFSKNDGLQNQSVLYRQDSLDAEAQVVLDPNGLSEDGTIALTSTSFTKDGTLMVYALSRSGSDWQELHIRRIESGEDYPEILQWSKFTNIAWLPDNTGFYYMRFPTPGTVPPEDQNNFSRVYWHRLGTDQAEDQLVYERPDDKELAFDPNVTEDGQYLYLIVWRGTSPRNRFYYRETGSNGPFVPLLDAEDARYSFIDNDGPIFYFNTDLDAPRGRVIAIDLARPEPASWREIISQDKDVLSYVTTVNNQFVTAYLHDAHDRLRMFDLDGSPKGEITLPTLGSVVELAGKREHHEMFIGFTSFLFPTTIYHYDFKKSELKVFRQSELNFDPAPYETRQVFYNSKDGTRIPMFLVHRRGLKLDGQNPTLLYGYGGFNISLTPSFSLSRLVWLENGGVFALANLRGGGEYGEEWHQAGTLASKQNVFDDFQAAAHWLTAQNYTNPRKLAIMGGSNGGLLVAACMIQRPELFGAVVCQVPVTDMLRFHKFTVGRYWVSDYGNAEADPEQFRFLYAYSPLHNVRPDVSYPPTLIATADTDDRVVPLHAKKFAATLQANHRGPNPILLRIETKAGHGAGKPTAKVIDELADTYAFLFKIFGMRNEG